MKSTSKSLVPPSRQGNPARPIARVEPRWPVALAVLSVLLLFLLLPGRSRLLPTWSGFALGAALILLMAGVRFGGNRPR